LHLAVGALLVAAGYLATLAWTGHAAAGPPVQVVSDVTHLIAAGAWLGALPGFVVLLGCAQPVSITAQVTRRFSTLGVLSVGTLVVTGIGNAWYLVGDVPGLIGTAYGRLLLAKLALFAAMVTLASDPGSGADRMDRIFDPFFTTKRTAWGLARRSRSRSPTPTTAT
jgi:putative copper resistance protein D